MTSRSNPRSGRPGRPDRQEPAGSRGKWVGFAVILAAMILNILDSTILNVAAPSIQRDLSLTTSALEWIAAAYTLALAVGLMAGARLGDAFGRKRMLMIGLVGLRRLVGALLGRVVRRDAGRRPGRSRAWPPR